MKLLKLFNKWLSEFCWGEKKDFEMWLAVELLTQKYYAEKDGEPYISQYEEAVVIWVRFKYNSDSVIIQADEDGRITALIADWKKNHQGIPVNHHMNWDLRRYAQNLIDGVGR